MVIDICQLLKALSMLMRFQKKRVFAVIENASIDSRPHYRFDAFSTVYTNTIHVCAFVLIHFQERFQIDAFSMKTLSVLVWTEGLNGSKCTRFQMKTR